jgi:hypothetical protein
MILPSPKYAKAKGREHEIKMLGLLYEEGCATASKLGQFVFGIKFNPRHSFHHRIIRRLGTAQQIASFSGPLRERLFYITREGAARIKDEGGIAAENYLGSVDYHSGRSGLTILHNLGVLDCRIRLEDSDCKWIPKSIIQAAWQQNNVHIKAIPDALVGRESDLDFWPYKIPFALEFERSSKSRKDRYLKIFRGESLLGNRVAGVIIVTRQSQVDLWLQTLDELSFNPQFEILTRKGKTKLSVSPLHLRFWKITTLEKLAGAVDSARAAHTDGITPFPWDSYRPWLNWWEYIRSPY